MNEQNTQMPDNTVMPNQDMSAQMPNQTVAPAAAMPQMEQPAVQPANPMETVMPSMPAEQPQVAPMTEPAPVMNNEVEATPLSEQTPNIAPTFEGMPTPPVDANQNNSMAMPNVNPAEPVIQPMPQMEQPAVQPVIEPINVAQPAAPIQPVSPEPVAATNIEMPAAQNPTAMPEQPMQMTQEPVAANPQPVSDPQAPATDAASNMFVTSENNAPQNPTSPW